MCTYTQSQGPNLRPSQSLGGGGQIRFIKLMEGTQEIMSEALKGRTIADMMGEILFHIDGDE